MKQGETIGAQRGIWIHHHDSTFLAALEEAGDCRLQLHEDLEQFAIFLFGEARRYTTVYRSVGVVQRPLRIASRGEQAIIDDAIGGQALGLGVVEDIGNALEYFARRQRHERQVTCASARIGGIIEAGPQGGIYVLPRKATIYQYAPQARAQELEQRFAVLFGHRQRAVVRGNG